MIWTEFPSVLYNFVSDDGRMVSHSRYESKVFGSGWFNADGRVVVLSASDGGTSEAPQQTVQVSSMLRLHHRRARAAQTSTHYNRLEMGLGPRLFPKEE